MPRIRSIKPEFWSDWRMTKLPALTRLVYVCLWSMADDEGRVEGDADSVWRFGGFVEDSRMVANALDALRDASRIVVYEVGGTPYIALPNFNSHQKIDKPSPSKLPPPPGTCGDSSNGREDSPNVRRTVAPDQGSGIREGSREQGAARGPGARVVIGPDKKPVDVAELRRVEEFARATHGVASFDTKVEAAAMVYPLPFVMAALEETPPGKPWGYVISICKRLTAQGGLDPAPTGGARASPTPARKVERRMDPAELERIAAERRKELAAWRAGTTN